MLGCLDYIMYGVIYVNKKTITSGLSVNIFSVLIVVLTIHLGYVMYTTHANGAEILNMFLEIAMMLMDFKLKLAVEENVTAVVDSATLQLYVMQLPEEGIGEELEEAEEEEEEEEDRLNK